MTTPLLRALHRKRVREAVAELRRALLSDMTTQVLPAHLLWHVSEADVMLHRALLSAMTMRVLPALLRRRARETDAAQQKALLSDIPPRKKRIPMRCITGTYAAHAEQSLADPPTFPGLRLPSLLRRSAENVTTL